MLRFVLGIILQAFCRSFLRPRPCPCRPGLQRRCPWFSLLVVFLEMLCNFRQFLMMHSWWRLAGQKPEKAPPEARWLFLRFVARLGSHSERAIARQVLPCRLRSDCVPPQHCCRFHHRRSCPEDADGTWPLATSGSLGQPRVAPGSRKAIRCVRYAGPLCALFRSGL